jgi:hypothetical protein
MESYMLDWNNDWSFPRLLLFQADYGKGQKSQKQLTVTNYYKCSSVNVNSYNPGILLVVSTYVDLPHRFVKCHLTHLVFSEVVYKFCLIAEPINLFLPELIASLLYRASGGCLFTTSIILLEMN